MPANACCHTKSGVVDTKSGVVDSYYHTRLNEQTGRTGQLVLVEIKNLQTGRTGQLVRAETKGRHVDELAEFRGDRPCQRK